MTMHAKWMYHTLTQGIRTIKSFSKYIQKVLLLIILSEKTQARLNGEITVTK